MSSEQRMPRHVRRSIRQSPDHVEALCHPLEPGTHPNVSKPETARGGTKETLRWINSEKDPCEAARVTDSGYYCIGAVRTPYVEFRLSEPRGASLKCTCNECWLTYWIAPFGEAVECPRCHARKVNIATEPNIGGREEADDA